MKKLLQHFLMAALLLGSAQLYTAQSCKSDCDKCCVGPCDGYPLLLPRSQSRNAAREIVGWEQFIHQYDAECTNGAFYMALEYTRSFRPEHLARYLFGCNLDCANALRIQGSQVESKNNNSWLADYFGLSPKFDSQISFCPRIQNVIIDMHLHLGLDEWAKGLFFKIYAPIAWTKWELNMCECIKNDGTADNGTGFDAGYMSSTAIARNKLPNSFTEAVSGTTVFGDMKESLKFGRITNCKHTKVRLADIRFSLGYDFKLCEDYHAGVFVHAAAPTGNRPTSCYLFEPIAGNGKHWELGFGFTGSWKFWHSCEYDNRHLGIWLDATFSHLFKDCQCRSFDLCGRPNSRYMLLEEMGSNGDSIGDGTTTAQYQYQKNLIPMINWSTLNIDVTISLQADIALTLGYIRDNWTFDIGYNLWARSGEKFCRDCNCEDSCYNCNTSCSCPSDKKYALKGDAFIYGYECSSYSEVEEDLVCDTNLSPVPLSATQSAATICAGKNYPLTDDVIAARNPRIDNPKDAYKDENELYPYNAENIIDPEKLTKTSIQPILVTRSMLNTCKGPSAITHKIFAHLGYAWKDCEDDWVPFVGAGFEAEFAQTSDCCYDKCGKCNCNNCCNTGCEIPCTTSCNTKCKTGDCSKKRAGVHQYGFWLKGGFSFD